MDGPIASAVVLPEEIDPLPASSPSHKRRQSSVSEQDPKRPRLNGDDAESERRPSIANAKAPSKPRERGRERRLFGAALGALSQNSATAAQKRRSEIEKRQQAQRKLEEEESEQRKLEREVGRKAQRQKEQKRFEQESMRIRHDNLLHMAHFLRTEAEPRLYYKPWELDPDDEDRISEQIAEAREIIRRELHEYEAQRKGDTERERHASREEEANRDADTHAQDGKESNANTQQAPTANGGTNGSIHSPKDPERRDDHAAALTNEAVSEEPAVANEHNNNITSHEAAADESSKDLMDENGEEMVEEAAEDTVIY